MEAEAVAVNGGVNDESVGSHCVVVRAADSGDVVACFLKEIEVDGPYCSRAVEEDFGGHSIAVASTRRRLRTRRAIVSPVRRLEEYLSTVSSLAAVQSYCYYSRAEEVVGLDSAG